VVVVVEARRAPAPPDDRLIALLTPAPRRVYAFLADSGGSVSGVLSDFFIGAHAVVEGLSLLTRDARRYRTYFPSITLITPGTA
jgi:hypothetical protein